ncbi:MAG: hypothetical protein F9K24_04445 [Leptonema illini]|uniref:PpiC domain-containing protein n=1 Tax=Leptonema illini TaxID=183 RepID=A0A833LZK1_9LEPT|nr:MAG: hypothetical protein F9K24_04445 [Leptonema illini]
MVPDRRQKTLLSLVVIVALVCSDALSAGPEFDEVPQTIDHYRQDILRYSAKEIARWEEIERINNLPPGAALNRLMLRFIMNPGLMDSAEGVQQRGKAIDQLRRYAEKVIDDEVLQKTYPGLIESIQAEQLFFEKRYNAALQKQLEVEKIERQKFENLAQKRKGRHFNREAAYTGVIEAMLRAEMFRAMYLRFQPEGIPTNQRVSLKRIDCAAWDCVPGHFQYWLALHIIYDDPEGFKKAIRDDMKGGRSRSHTFLSKEVNALYFEYFRDHEYWLTDSFKRVLDEMERENDRLLPSCKTVSLFGECVK